MDTETGEERLNEEPQAAPKARRARRQSFARDSRAVLDEREADERGHDEREQTEDRDLTEDDRLEIFRDSLDQSVLPDLPKIPGFHLCWLTTSNPRDTVARRQQLGYQLIRADELPGGWQGAGGNAAQYPGVISVNEMLAARIPISLYNAYMREVHDRMPRSEEQKLRRTVDDIKMRAESLGAKLQEGDGTEQIVQRAPPMPSFLE